MVALYIARTIAGLGVGIVFLIVPVYLSHFTKASAKLKTEQGMYVMMMLGAMITYVLAYDGQSILRGTDGMSF